MGYIHRGVHKAEISEDGDLILTLTDGTTMELGRVLGEKGEKGDKGEVDEYILEWHLSPSDDEKNANTEILMSAYNADSKSIYLYRDGKYFPASSFEHSNGLITAVFADHDNELLETYVVRCTNSGKGYEQWNEYRGINSLSDDDLQLGLATAEGVKAYVLSKLAGALTIDSEVLL